MGITARFTNPHEEWVLGLSYCNGLIEHTEEGIIGEQRVLIIGFLVFEVLILF